MTMKQSLDRENSVSDLHKSRKFFSPKAPIDEFSRKPKWCAAELDTDQETNGSSEEMESQRSVVKRRQWTPNKFACVHIRILRIKEEDSHIREDFGESLISLNARARENHLPAFDPHHDHLFSSHMDVMLFSRQTLPASPLSGTTTINNKK